MDTKKKWIKNNVYIFLLAAALYACQIQPIIPATGNIGQNAYSASFIQSGKLALAGESTLKNPSPLPSETALIEAATIAAPTTTPTSENLPNPTDTETSPPPPAASATLEAVDTDIPTITITPTASPSITKTSTITITASPAVTSTGTSTTDQVSWSVEVAVPVSNPEVRQEGGQNAVKENIIEEVEQNLADSQVQSDVQIATTNNTVTIYKVILKGEDGIEQMKDTIYDDLASQINLLSGATQLTITGNVTAGEFWPLTLQSNISTGYDWEVVSLDNTTLQVVSENQEQKVEGIGMPAVQTIRFRGVKDGSTTLKLAYRRPWEPTEQVVNKIMIQAGDSLSQATDLTAPEGSAAAQAQENPAPIPTLVVRSPEKQAGAVGLPTSFDWRTQGGITSVKNQASCGSCWAFSTVGVMEGAMKRAGLGDIDLSEQYLVNCNNQGWNCTYGGWWAHDYHINRYISPQTQAGAVLESALPYTATNGSCTQAYSHPYRLSNWYSIAGDTIPTEAQMKQAIYDYGPVSIAICVGSSGSSSFGAYTSGIFQTNETSICGGGVNHAVILTGWDDNTSPPSWILKNSWGTSWGESGYMRIARTISNVGFSANYVLYSGSVPPPANDDFNSAIVISASPYQNIQSTTSATTASDDPTPSCGYGRKNNSVWYRYTAQGAYTISANTIGSSYDTVLSVWSGSRGSLTAIACDDDSGGNYTSNLSFTPTSGQTYYFMASSYSSGGGNLTLNMQQQIPVGVGTYDDTNANIVYSGSWTLYSGTGLGLYNNTLHWTVTNGANAMLTFTGNSITIQNRITYGDVKVEIDGVTYSPITYTAIGNGIGRWTSPSLSSGTHTLVITNTTRSQREIDAIIVNGPPTPTPTQTYTPIPTQTPTPLPPVGVGTYDDTNANIVYSGSWTLYSGTGLGLYNNTLHWTVTNGANAMLTFTGNSITIQNRITYGDVKVEIDGVTYSPITYTAIGNGIGRWTSPSLSSGTHTLVITNTTSSQREIDAIIVNGPPTPTPTQTYTPIPTQTPTPLPPVGVGTYDDTNANIVYSGSWTLYSGTGLGLYNNTLHWTVTNGANAMLTFTGNSITIQNRITYGDVKVEIDGVTYSPITYTAIGNGIGRWTSPSLSSGTHTLVITNTTRSQREIDAIEVLGAPPETMDDSNASITYTGTGWNNYEGLLGGPLNGTGHYTQHPGDVASLTFTGRGVKIVYTGSTNRAPGQVRIDGTLVVTLNQSTSELLWQQEWQSASLANGEHTLTITHVGTSNQYMDLDAIIVIK